MVFYCLFFPIGCFSFITFYIVVLFPSHNLNSCYTGLVPLPLRLLRPSFDLTTTLSHLLAPLRSVHKHISDPTVVMPRHARTGSESRPNRRPQSYAEPAHVYAQRVNDFYATVSQAQASIPHQDSGYDASFDTQPQPQPQTQVQPQLPPQMQMQPVEHIAAASANRAGASAWAPSDDRLLVASRIEGLNWSEIRRKHFPNKSPNACRKRHERLMERRNTDQWDGYKMQRLAKEYMSMRKEIWEPLAARTGEKWSFVEHKVPPSSLFIWSSILFF